MYKNIKGINMRIFAIAPNNINTTNTRQNNRIAFLGKFPKNTNVGDTFEKSLKARIAEEKKMLKLRNKARDFSCCFYRTVSPNEVENLQQKYKSIVKIKDKDEFLDKAFNELKKDFGLAEIPIKLNKDFKRGKKSLNIKSAAEFVPRYNEGFIEIKVDKRYSNKTLFSHIAHEIRHAVQQLKIYQYGVKEDFKNAEFNKFIDAYPDTNKSDYVFVKEIIKNHVNAHFDFFQKAGVKKIKKKDGGYKYVQKLLEDDKKCHIKTSKDYHSSYAERDAYGVQYLLMDTIFKK